MLGRSNFARPRDISIRPPRVRSIIVKCGALSMISLSRCAGRLSGRSKQHWSIVPTAWSGESARFGCRVWRSSISLYPFVPFACHRRGILTRPSPRREHMMLKARLAMAQGDISASVPPKTVNPSLCMCQSIESNGKPGSHFVHLCLSRCLVTAPVLEEASPRLAGGGVEEGGEMAREKAVHVACGRGRGFGGSDRLQHGLHDEPRGEGNGDVTGWSPCAAWRGIWRRISACRGRPVSDPV